MTSPVLTQIQNSNNELVNMNSNVEMSMIFYVPKSDQDNTPNPKGANEFVKNEVEMTVATIRFGGWASMPKYIAKRDELIKMLGEAANEYDTVNMITAEYDSPMKLFGRRNEVLLKKK